MHRDLTRFPRGYDHGGFAGDGFGGGGPVFEGALLVPGFCETDRSKCVDIPEPEMIIIKMAAAIPVGRAVGQPIGRARGRLGAIGEDLLNVAITKGRVGFQD